ncbi:DUF4202 domain-containing protein [Rapidithrix thailandica]|uniref:DUF4202 domain-containing protein n=1 Tax=Rapidithrix thailandica TaxID=413964 RepID=A0AAW9S9F9_9BACT
MSTLFTQAIQAFDEYNANDPNHEIVGEGTVAKELLYAQRMTQKLMTFAPEASEALQLAVRCQHIGRWEIARKDFPMDRVGYLQWRNKEKQHHAEVVEEILSHLEYPRTTIDRVKFLVQKKQMKHDEESQTLEDVVCLVFMEYYFEDFAKEHDEEKVLSILQKTWKKMSEKGREAALQLSLSEYALALVNKALS